MSRHSSRTAHRIIQLAALGFAGLLAGLLSGCSASPKTIGMTSYAYSSTQDPQAQPPTLPVSLDANSIPPLRHQPSARRLEYGAVHLSQIQTPGS